MVKLALILWPAVILVLFKQLKPAVAVSVALIGGYLLLPSKGGWNFPLVPVMDKDSITAIVTLIGALFIAATLRHLPETRTFMRPGWFPRSKIGISLAMILVVGNILTAVNNSNPLVLEGIVLPGLGIYHGISDVAYLLISLIPLILARKFLAHPETQVVLLVTLAVAGLLYSLPALYEIRMSPQLNRLIYGFFPHDWQQHLRGDGFRPVVFLHHGLWLGIFLSMSVIASAVIVNIDKSRRAKYILILAWLFVTLLLSKNFGALAITVLIVPCVLLMPAAMQLLMAATISMIVLLYPALRGVGWVPTTAIVSMVETYRPARALSLQYRLDNEQILLDKANEKPFLGWGAYNRNRVYDDTGRDISTTDGNWIIAIGQGGWVRYFSQMGLMTLPIVFLALNRRRYRIGAITAGLGLVLTANMIDLLPNSALTPVTWLIAGALLGRLELGRIAEEAPEKTKIVAAPRTRYTRQTNLVVRKE